MVANEKEAIMRGLRRSEYVPDKGKAVSKASIRRISPFTRAYCPHFATFRVILNKILSRRSFQWEKTDFPYANTTCNAKNAIFPQ